MAASGNRNTKLNSKTEELTIEPIFPLTRLPKNAREGFLKWQPATNGKKTIIIFKNQLNNSPFHSFTAYTPIREH